MKFAKSSNTGFSTVAGKRSNDFAWSYSAYISLIASVISSWVTALDQPVASINAQYPVFMLYSSARSTVD